MRHGGAPASADEVAAPGALASLQTEGLQDAVALRGEAYPVN